MWQLSLCMVLWAQDPAVEGTPLPEVPPAPQTAPSPMMEGTLVVADPVDPRPKPIHRPWWDLGVSERTYRRFLPTGPGQGTVTPEQAASFWERYADARRENVAVDALELAFLVAPMAFAVAALAVLPLTGLPGLAQALNIPGAPPQQLVRAVFVGMPAAALLVFGVGALGGLAFTSLSSLDAQDLTVPPLPVKSTPAGRRALAAAERGRWTNVLVGVGALVALAALVPPILVTPWILPLMLGPWVGADPATMALAYGTVVRQVGPLGMVTAAGAHLALVAVLTLVPGVMATGYLMRALPGVLDDDADQGAPPTAGEDRDLSSVLDPRNFLFPAKRKDPESQKSQPDGAK